MAATLRMRGCGVSDLVTVLPVPPQTEKRHGILRFVGPTEFDNGNWVGIELVVGKGHNDGSVKGKSYFHCPPGQGVFVRPEVVVPYNSDARVDAEASSPVRMENETAAKEEDLLAVLRHDNTLLQEELRRKEKAFQEIEKELCMVTALLEGNVLELGGEGGEKEQLGVVPLLQHVTDAGKEMETENETEKEMRTLRQQCRELKELCDIQEEELQRQREHADDLSLLLENMRSEYSREREELQERIRRLEADLVQHPKVLDAATTAEEAMKEDVEALRLQLFQHQKQKEALQLLKQRYDQLYSEREQDRHDNDERWKKVCADYEEALMQQREYKNRLIEENRALQQKIMEMCRCQERERSLRMPLSSGDLEGVRT